MPEQLATAHLASMPPITGFYAFLAGTVLFALLGSNARMSVGADSTIAPLFAVGIAGLATLGSPAYVNLVGILAVAVGVIVASVGLLRLGWIAEFLSAPIISGFMAGVAVIIVIHELPELLGIHGVSGTNVQRVGTIVTHLGDVNGWTVGIGVAVLAVVVALERINKRIPAALFGVAGSTIAVAALGLQSHGVEVLGTFAHGAPRLGLVGVSWSAITSVLPLAAVVSLVVISQSAATTRAFPGPEGQEANVSRDFLGVGAGSMAAGLIGAFPVNASPPRTGAVVSAGGRTQVTGLVAAAALLLLIPVAGPLSSVPLATLAAVLLFVAGRIFPLRELRAIWRFDLVEFSLAAITLATVALVGVEQGIGVAVGLAILDRTRHVARPHLHVLGRIPGTTSWVPLSSTRAKAAQLPGLLLVLFSTPLWYANSDGFHGQFAAALKRAIGPLRVVVLDAIGMSDIDYTGSRALRLVLDDLDRMHVTFAVARAGERLRLGLAHSGLLERIGEDHIFTTANEAVVALEKEGS